MLRPLVSTPQPNNLFDSAKTHDGRSALLFIAKNSTWSKEIDCESDKSITKQKCRTACALKPLIQNKQPQKPPQREFYWPFASALRASFTGVSVQLLRLRRATRFASQTILRKRTTRALFVAEIPPIPQK